MTVHGYLEQANREQHQRLARGPGFARGVAVLILLVNHPLHAAPGDLDPAFGQSGIAIGPTGNTSAMVLQPDGKIVTMGDVQGTFGFTRLLATGQPDVAFGTNGIALPAPGSTSCFNAGLVLQPDGKLVASGWCWNGTDYDFTVVRLRANGRLDSGFGVGGKTTTPVTPGSGDFAEAIALQPDGKILAAGHTFGTGPSQVVVARYQSQGAIDTTFGVGGLVTSSASNFVHAVAVQPDGKIVLFGEYENGSGFTLLRYLPTGAPDLSFGTGGAVRTAIGTGSHPWGLALQTDGKLVGAGYSFVPGSVLPDFSVARYLPNGTPDQGFGTAGTLTTAVGSGTDDFGSSIAIQRDQKILVAG